MRSKVLTLTLIVLPTLAASAHADITVPESSQPQPEAAVEEPAPLDAASLADYIGQDDPLPQSVSISGRALTEETEVLTPKGIMNEDNFTATHTSVPLVAGTGFDDEGTSYGKIEPAAGDSQTPYATVTGKAPSQEITGVTPATNQPLPPEVTGITLPARPDVEPAASPTTPPVY